MISLLLFIKRHGQDTTCMSLRNKLSNKKQFKKYDQPTKSTIDVSPHPAASIVSASQSIHIGKTCTYYRQFI